MPAFSRQIAMVIHPHPQPLCTRFLVLQADSEILDYRWNSRCKRNWSSVNERAVRDICKERDGRGSLTTGSFVSWLFLSRDQDC